MHPSDEPNETFLRRPLTKDELWAALEGSVDCLFPDDYLEHSPEYIADEILEKFCNLTHDKIVEFARQKKSDLKLFETRMNE